jgi:hypothetical protein
LVEQKTTKPSPAISTRYVARPITAVKAILGAFAELIKATFSSYMSVRQPVRMEQLGSQWTDFYEI